MLFISSLLHLLQSLFGGSDPESRARREMYRIENQLKAFQPAVYRNDMVLPVIGDAFNILHTHTKKINEVLSATLFSSDIQLRAKYTDMLVFSGFTGESREMLKTLLYQNRKEQVSHAENQPRCYEEQRRTEEKLLGMLNGADFRQIEKVIGCVEQLYDICRYNYITVLHLFDGEYMPDVLDHEPHFKPVPVAALEEAFMDMSYISGKLNLSMSVARAVVVLAEQKNGGTLDEKDSQALMGSMKKIAGIFSRILTPGLLTGFLAIIKNDPSFVPESAVYNRQVLQDCAARLKNQFESDTRRIRAEIQDDVIFQQTEALFGDRPVLQLQGYNTTTSSRLIQNNIPAFLWITPLQIVKSFLMYFITDPVLSLLNDIIVEGFFENQTYKTDFAADVFACTEFRTQIQAFEDTFLRGGENDLTLMNSYLLDGHQNPDLFKKLEQMVLYANDQAEHLVQSIVVAFSSLLIKMDAMIADSKRPKPVYVSNIKVLFMSVRNRDNVNQVEKDFAQWRNFLDIMKNYVIISGIEKNIT